MRLPSSSVSKEFSGGVTKGNANSPVFRNVCNTALTSLYRRLSRQHCSLQWANATLYDIGVRVQRGSLGTFSKPELRCWDQVVSRGRPKILFGLAGIASAAYTIEHGSW